MSSLRIDVWSDIACPWCWVGKRHLEQAIEASGQPVEVVWHAFELDPRAPTDVDPQIPYAARLARKYGVAEAQAQGMIDQMTERGAGVGLDFRFDRVQPTNTFDAHRLIAWARSLGRQVELAEGLFAAYMTEGRRVSDPDALADVAEAAGLDPVEARRVLASEDFAAEVRADEASAHQIGVSGVPFFVIGGRFAVSGAQPPEVLEGAIAKAGEAVGAPPADACGPDGCAVP